MNDDAPAGDSETPVDPELQAGFSAAPHRGSVLEHMKSRIGGAPKVTLHADEGSGGAPLIDPGSTEKLALPQGRGTYQLLGEIAQGGMGVILKGHDVDLGRDVAVKVLHKDLCQRPEVLQRFVEEAQIGGQLQHPGIVPVYELGLMADERPYFTMKLVKGRTLATLIAERESPQEDRRGMLDVFGSICQTMAYAHSRGVIHRDLKPANVMVGAFGEVQVVDWGLAKVLGRGGVADERKAREARADMTILETVRSDGTRSGTDSMVGSVMGTPAYMPPEQAQGKVDKLDERSDVFSLGAILCEILTGSPPYGGEQEKTLFQAAQAELDPALERLETCDADPELVKLTQQCLMPAPTARPRNAGVLAERIRRHLESLEERTHAAQVEAAEARVREVQARKARRLTLALAAAVLGLVVTGGGAWMWTSNERAAREREEVNRELAAATRERALAGDVDDALSQASLLRGQAQWTGALAAVDRALGLAEGGGAGDALLERIEAAGADIRRSADEARAQAERERASEELLRELQEAGRAVEFAGFSQSLPLIEAEYHRVFIENGLDVDAMMPGEVADAFLERGLGSEIASILDSWILVRNALADSTGGLEAEAVRRQALHLVNVTREVDPDPVRGDLRRALIQKDVGFLVRLADSDLDGQPPTTLALLGTALELVGWRDKSLRVLRDGVYRYPDVFTLRMALVQVLMRDFRNERWNPRTAEELIGNTTAALGLRPQNTYLRVLRYWQLRGLGTEHLRHGQVDEARESMYEAARLLQAAMEASSEPFWRFPKWIGHALLWSGRHEEALAVLRSGQEAYPERNEYIVDITNCLFEMRRFDDAVAAAEAGLVAFPGNIDLLGYLAPCRALSEVARGDVAGALEAVDAVLPRDRDDRAFLLNNIGWFSSVVTPENLLARSDELSAGERERAIEALREYQSEVRWIVEEAVEIDPRSGNIWNTLGIVRYRGGDMQGAIEAAERSLEFGEVGFECLDRLVLAMAHHQLGNEEEATRQYERSKHRNEGMNASSAVEMPPLWAEAEALLGIDPRRR